MGIENEIHQTRFASSRQKAMINLLYTYGWVIEKIRILLSTEDITHQQFNILRILRGSSPQPLSTLQIRERMLDKMSDTSRIVDRLVAKGFVQKKTCLKDKRLVDVSITKKGLDLLLRIDSRIAPEQDPLKNLTESEAAQLSRLLDKIRYSVGN